MTGNNLLPTYYRKHALVKVAFKLSLKDLITRLTKTKVNKELAAEGTRRDFLKRTGKEVVVQAGIPKLPAAAAAAAAAAIANKNPTMSRRGFIASLGGLAATSTPRLDPVRKQKILWKVLDAAHVVAGDTKHTFALARGMQNMQNVSKLLNTDVTRKSLSDSIRAVRTAVTDAPVEAFDLINGLPSLLRV